MPLQTKIILKIEIFDGRWGLTGACRGSKSLYEQWFFFVRGQDVKVPANATVLAPERVPRQGRPSTLPERAWWVGPGGRSHWVDHGKE